MLVSAVLVSLVFVFFFKFPTYWQPWLAISPTLIFIVSSITFLLAAQFSRSRYSLLTIFWLLIYLALYFNIRWFDSVDLSLFTTYQGNSRQSDWLMLLGVFFMSTLTLIKDRGILSIHSFYRIAMFVAVLVAAYAWLKGAALIEHHYLAKYHWLEYVAIELPLVLAALLISWQSYKSTTLFAPSIAATLLIWSLYYYQVLQLPWAVTFFLFFCHYLIVVLIDSYFLAYRDELTELPSRRALQQLVLSLGRNYTVAMLDIDHFKKFNDTYGHDIGDQVLKLVASKLAKVKSGGRVFRYGGEEFTVVFPRKHIDQTLHELEQLRQSVADYKMVIRQQQRQSKQARNKGKSDNLKTVSVTISIGVAMRESKQNFDQVLKAADQALYRAKKSGRNNVSQ
ncbi:diguanylate cyclase [Thalassotalea sp. PLHSN55]|uniref:GGDEF domain-containing protein n=1 Tax=Thalassotalea sp. PLHSN55 TaxID=3435888 RepID=UPI003F8312EC